MIAILCLDENFGMMFNSRRQTMDSVVRADIMNTYDKVIMSEYSKSQFEEIFHDRIDEVSSFQYIKDGVLFVEDVEIDDYSIFDTIVVYYWNKKYPSDLRFDESILNRYDNIESTRIKGSSHDEIDRVVYKR